MYREHSVGIVSTAAAVLLLVVSIVASRGGEPPVARNFELMALPSAVVLVLILAYVVFRALVPLAEALDNPARLALGMSLLGLLAALVPFWLGPFSIDWGFPGALSVVLGSGGALVGARHARLPAEHDSLRLLFLDAPQSKPSSWLGVAGLAVVLGLCVVAANFTLLVLDFL